MMIALTCRHMAMAAVQYYGDVYFYSARAFGLSL